MEKVKLDKDDVTAIARQREFPSFKGQKYLKGATAVSGGLGMLIIFILAGFEASPFSIAGLIGFVFLAIAGVLVLLMDKRRTKQRNAFIEHWERTGEIPPRLEEGR